MLKLGRLTREHMVKELTALFKENDAAIVGTFKAVSAARFQQLKKPLKLSKVRFKVVKNSIARIAAKNAKVEPLAPLFEGTCAVGFCSPDAFVSISKAFVNFSKENEGFKVCGGAIAGEFVSFDKIKEYALLPSKEVLLAKAVGAIKWPISGFVGVLNNLVNGFVRVVDQIAKKKGGTGNE